MGFWEQLRRVFSSSSRQSVPAVGAVQTLLRYRFRDEALLARALAHRSATKGQHADASNERLEFLGDSVLGLVIAHQLFRDHPELAEGDLTKMKSMLVNETSLAAVGRMIGLNQHILLSSEEERSGGRERPSIIADAVESVIGAVYLDGGYDAARAAIVHMIYANRQSLQSDVAPRNFKGELLELTQASMGIPPRYEVIAEEGPDHEKKFRVAVFVSSEVLGEGSGASKKEAEQQAASAALRRLTLS